MFCFFIPFIQSPVFKLISPLYATEKCNVLIVKGMFAFTSSTTIFTFIFTCLTIEISIHCTFRILYIGGKEGETKKESLLAQHLQKGCHDKSRHCKFCLHTHEYGDICNMRLKSFKKDKRAKMCFIAFSICDSYENQIECWECHTTEKVCHIHEQFADTELRENCNLVSILREIGTFGSFEHEDYIFKNPAENCFQKKVGINLPNQFATNEKTDTNPGRTKYNKFRKCISLEDIQEINPRDSLEFFLQQALMQKSFCNSMIIGMVIQGMDI